MFNLIVSQGRIADRSNGMIDGAKLTAERIKNKYNVDPLFLGEFSPAKMDRWPDSLTSAKDNLSLIQKFFKNFVKTGGSTVFVSNTCSASLATLPIITNHHPDAIIIWIDAHGDFNTPATSSSGYLGGMVLSAVSGLWDSGFGSGLKPSQLLLVGARDIDEQESKLLKKLDICVIPPSNGMTEKILNIVGSSPVYIHIDWDVMEPGYLPADYSVPSGLIPDQIRRILTSLSVNKVIGLEIAEFIPSYDESIDKRSLDTIIYMIEPMLNKLNAMN